MQDIQLKMEILTELHSLRRRDQQGHSKKRQQRQPRQRLWGPSRVEQAAGPLPDENEKAEDQKKTVKKETIAKWRQAK
jgi:hypothetical protein